MGQPGRLMRRVRARFADDNRGVAALEMALVAPIMISMLLGLIETVDVLMVDRKVTTMTTSVADLVARVSEIDDQGLLDVYAASKAIMQPFSNVGSRVRVTSITRDNSNNILVHWSSSSTGTSPYTEGEPFPKSLPNGILGANESVIFAEVEYDYAGPITDFFFNAFMLENEYYSKPRRSRTVLRCDDLSAQDPVCY